MLWLLTVSIQELGGRINSLNSDLVKTEKFGQEKMMISYTRHNIYRINNTEI